MRPILRRAVAACAAVSALLLGAVPAAGLTVGIQDDRIAQPQLDPAPRVAAAAATGARMIRVDLRWDQVAHRRPATPTDPADPAYDWAHYDAVVAAARARGMRPLMVIWGTPAWAADTSAPVSSFPAYSVRPRRPADVGDFATAAARRYAPRGVMDWESWNEPNIPLFLRPQYARRGGRWVAVSPRTYSAIATSVYRGIKSVSPRARVAGGVTAPTGDLDPQGCPVQPDCRVRPQDFVRLLNAKGLRPPMDAWSHHPYPLRRPADRTPPNRAYVDLYNLDTLFGALDATYLRGKPVWLTEFGFATRRTSQYPFFVTPAEQARYMADAFRRMRATPRVRVFVWYLLQDHPDWASGVLDVAGKRKPSYVVFRRQALLAR